MATKEATNHLVENTSERQIDINLRGKNKEIRTISIPGAVFGEGNKKTNGWVVVNAEDLEKMKEHKVISSFFDENVLVDAGETEAEEQSANQEDLVSKTE